MAKPTIVLVERWDGFKPDGSSDQSFIITRRTRAPSGHLSVTCPECGFNFFAHGEILNYSGVKVEVCPGDYVFTDDNGLLYHVKKNAFDNSLSDFNMP